MRRGDAAEIEAMLSSTTTYTAQRVSNRI
jgi:hypothetical protein